MATYKINGEELALIKEKPFKLERELQKLTEDNLGLVFGLKFVRSEFSINNFRIDSLAYDEESKSFVIIEYKNNKNFSVIDQGYAYLSLMLNNKADFILEYNESLGTSLMRNDVDWSQSKVLFISPKFTTYQREAINFKDLPIELWEITKYENNTVSYSEIGKSRQQESIKTISKIDSKIETVSKEVKVYTEEEHLSGIPEEIKELYDKLRTSILNFGDIKIKAKKLYVAFVGNRNIVDLRIQKNAVKMWINIKKGELDDSKQLARDVSNTGHWGNGDYELSIKDDENIEYILSLVKQSVKRNGK